MSNTPRYLATYRQDVMRLICDFARQGESLCLMGVAGTGKSNVTNFLRHDPYQHKSLYLGDETAAHSFSRRRRQHLG